MADAKKEYRFKTGPIIVSRAYLEPVKEPNTHGRWVNTLEAYPDKDNKMPEFCAKIIECAVDNGLVKLVNGKPDPTAVKQVYATIFKRLENTQKDLEKNEHLVDKVFFSMNKVRKPKDRDLTNPEERKEWQAYLKSECPKAYIINASGKRELIPFDKVKETIYPGCAVNVVGECYASTIQPVRICLDLQAVVLLEQRERCGPPTGSRRSDDDDDLLNSIAEPSKNHGDALDAMFGDTAASTLEVSEADIPF